MSFLSFVKGLHLKPKLQKMTIAKFDVYQKLVFSALVLLNVSWVIPKCEANIPSGTLCILFFAVFKKNSYRSFAE
jgi:hypothetical protein